MPGFNYQGPPFDRAQLQPGFRLPPSAPQLPGMPGMAPLQQTPGFNIGAGAGMLGAGLDALKGLGGGSFDPTNPGAAFGNTRGDADLGGHSGIKPGGMVDVGGGTMLPNPNGMQYGADGSPIGALPGGARDPGMLERLFSQLGMKLPRLF